MSGALTHTPGNIVRQLLIAGGQGAEPADGATWPVYSPGEPSTPDNCITVRTTAGQADGQLMIDGEIQEKHGIQVRIRSKNDNDGYAKLSAIREWLSQSIEAATVTIGGVRYRIHSFCKFGAILPLGTDSPNTKRHLCTTNFLATIRQLP